MARGWPRTSDEKRLNRRGDTVRLWGISVAIRRVPESSLRILIENKWSERNYWIILPDSVELLLDVDEYSIHMTFPIRHVDTVFDAFHDFPCTSRVRLSISDKIVEPVLRNVKFELDASLKAVQSVVHCWIS